VLEAVPENVDQAVANLRRRPERPRMIAIAPQAAGAAGRPIDHAGDSRGQALDAARERGAVCGLDDHVDMVALDPELHDAAREAAAGGRFEGVADLGGDREIAHVRGAVDRTERHVERVTRVELGPRAVADARLRSATVVVAAELPGRFAAGVFARPAPGRRS